MSKPASSSSVAIEKPHSFSLNGCQSHLQVKFHYSNGADSHSCVLQTAASAPNLRLCKQCLSSRTCSPALYTHIILRDTLLPFPRPQRPAEQTLGLLSCFSVLFTKTERGHFLRLTSIYTPTPFPICDLHINASQPRVSFLALGQWESGHRSGNEEFLFFLEETLVVKKLFISVKALPFVCWSDT